MNFQQDFFQPLSLQPSLPTLIEQDKQAFLASKSLKFDTLVKFFNRFSNMRGIKKSNYAKEFLKIVFKADRSVSFVYPILRLLLPGDDRDRGNYGLREKNLSKVISDSLNLTKQDYLRLHHYKNPSFHKTGVGIGDFSLCVYDVIKNYCKTSSSLTVLQLNEMLDEMAIISNNHISIFRKLFMICTAEQIKWIIRIILKDLKISIKIDTVLTIYHLDAHDFFNLTNSLLETCKKFQDPNVSLDDEIKIFYPIRPMLAGKKKIGFFNQDKKMYYVQTKFDGQRLQAHKKGSEVKLFSRNAMDYSKLYQQLTEVIKTHIEAQECILDGEMIVIQRDTLKMVPFGQNKVVALNKDDERRLCYKIFDILWVREDQQQINLMKYTLKQRKQILSKVVHQQSGIIEIVKYEQLTQYDSVLKRFSDSIDNNEQGIMLKDPLSLYIPKQRGCSWIKLKGDYVDGLTDTLDLIILGGYFGDSAARYGPSRHWSDQITSFLVGVIDRIDPMNNHIAYAIPFAKVGTGYSLDELNTLRSRLRDNLCKNQGRFKPPYLQCNWKPSLQDKPDCWITSLSGSLLLQVKAAEMIVSESYPTAYTLRFPRVVKIRYDKDWSEGQTINELKELADNGVYSKNLKRKLQESDSDGQGKGKEVEDKTNKKVKREKPGKKEGVYEDFMGFDMADEKILSHLFSAFQFCVFSLQNSKFSKLEIQRQIMLHDGIVVQNPLTSTQYIVTDVIDFKLRAYQTQKDRRYMFIKPNYVLNCIASNKILNLSPLYLTVLPSGNSKYYMQNFDRFGDSYVDYLDLRQLNQILQCMSGNYPINEKLMERVGLKERRKGKVSLCFGVNDLDKVKLRMNGNVIVDEFQHKPNSIILEGVLEPIYRKKIEQYQRNNEVVIEYVDDLVAIGIL